MNYAEEDRKRFDAAFTRIVDDVVSNEGHDKEIKDAVLKLRQVLEYNVPGGKRNRGLSVIGSIRHLLNEEDVTEDVINIAILLGWCVEWFQAFFLVADDIMDQSLTRRGQPCWYKKPDVGLIAVNDCIMMEQTVFDLLKKHIRHKDYYLDVVELFHEVAYLTSLGQSMDLITKPGKAFENFTLDRYKTIVKYKTAFYSFYLPVALALYMAGITDKETHENAKTILLEMGEFFQIQDDFLDAFGDPAITGKVGTDIEENKCTWLIVKALEKATPQQLSVIKENYGINDKEASSKVKDIYKDLNLEKVFRDYEETSHERMIQLILEKSQKIPKAVFLEFVQKIYKRKK
ncbi:farnesyl pyrophosphate synthase [Exaiptasia diaphana]|uniref:Farnesyl pyrophosphate synthase n=1 Tax=Exaiptasia diaphana TaxID=2652724 RepID=A0A913XYJ5_EXADI|nr:farnesyl pyrophosphate synthase [Exaiptasia diaphana]KXJ08015.1 Farnesyl pyrophosphate synthase [Exaiptasia diaphana]